jgi:hypothetical protein
VDYLTVLRSSRAYEHATSTSSLSQPVEWLPLDRLYEIRVAWWPETLWLAQDDRAAAHLVALGVGRARIWTVAVRSLLDTNAAPGASHDLVRAVAITRLEFDGDLVSVRNAPAGPAAKPRDIGHRR